MASLEDGVAKGPLKNKNKNKKTYREIEFEILYARIEGIDTLKIGLSDDTPPAKLLLMNSYYGQVSYAG
jgi:hypothetical protein